MNTTSIILFIASVLGLIAHAFKKAQERNKAQEPKYSIIDYFRDEMNGIGCNIICQFVIAYYSAGFKQIEQLPEWLIGPLFFALGYMGDSAFPSILELLPYAIDKFKAFFGFTKKEP